jgi:hypothetical protein
MQGQEHMLAAQSCALSVLWESTPGKASDATSDSKHPFGSHARRLMLSACRRYM